MKGITGARVVQKGACKAQKEKGKRHYDIFSSHCCREPAWLGLALMQIKPTSSLNRFFQLLGVQGLL
jgi:hypothetical protein